MAHREGQPRDADQSSVGGDQQDHRRQDPDVDPHRLGEARAEPQVLDDPQHRVVGERRPELGRELTGGVLGHRHRGEGDHRQQHVEPQHREHHQLRALRHGSFRVPRLLRHVRDRLDPGVGDHADRDAERGVAPGRRHAELHVVDQDGRVQHQRHSDHDQQDLGRQVADRQHQVEPRRLLRPLDVERRQQRDHHDARDHIAWTVAQRRPEDPQVVGHEEGRDGGRDDVVEHLAPAGDEADHLVEGMAGEARRPAGLRVHHRRLDVGGGGEGEDQPGDQEGDRGETEREARHHAERVVDRGADVPVGGREQRPHPVDAAKRLFPGNPLGHLSRL